MTKSDRRIRVGLALSGGAARGLAHLGVLRVLERERIPIDCVAGTSVGSVIGAAYCAGMEIEQLEAVAEQIAWRNIAALTWPVRGFVSFAKLERWMVALLGDLDFRDLSIPFAAVATDLESGKPIVLREERLAPAVRASCSVPGIVPPVQINGRPLVDGGISDNLPVAVVRSMGTDFVIGVDVCRPFYRRQWGPFGVGLTALETLVRGAGGGLGSADCLVSPDLAGFSYVRFSKRKDIVLRGVVAAEAQLPAIRAALSAGY